jgi:hypothetical protein
MKKTIALCISILTLLALFTGCTTEGRTGASEGPFTNDNRNDFADNTPVIISDEILQTCYRYADSLGYVIKDKDRYTSVLLGESLIDAVYTEGDDNKRAMIDKDDFIVIFEELRIVIDAETGAVLGRIPYV